MFEFFNWRIAEVDFLWVGKPNKAFIVLPFSVALGRSYDVNVNANSVAETVPEFAEV